MPGAGVDEDRQALRSLDEEYARREVADEVDIRLSPFLRSYADKYQLFHVTNHPCRPALARMANGILNILGYPGKVPYIGEEYLPYPHVPLLPSVRRFMNARQDTTEWEIFDHGFNPKWEIFDNDSYHLPKMLLHRSEYFYRAISHLKKLPRNQLMSCLNAAHVRPFLERLAISNPSLPGIHAWAFSTPAC